MTEPLLPPGTLVHDRYLVTGTLGRGGMGCVYEAVDQRLGNKVALKQMLVEGEVADRAFEREARLLAGLRHAGLPVVSDFFSDPRGKFLVMQFIPGLTLAEEASRRSEPFPVDQVMRWADGLLSVLEFLHGHRPPILHRDIKPANIKLTAQGEVVLLDFGLAKGSGETTVTAPSVYGLTPQYAPLEQFQGAGTDARSDLFALGATLHFLLTLQPPVDALTRAAAVAQGLPDPQAPASQLNPAVPAALGACLTKALAIDRGERHPSAAAMRADLAGALTAPTEIRRPPPPVDRGASTVLVAPPRRDDQDKAAALRGRAIGLAAAAVLLVLAGLAFFTGSRGEGGGPASEGSGPAAPNPAGAVVRFEPSDTTAFEFRWDADNYWVLMRGDEQVALEMGTAGRAVPPGTYRIQPSGEAVFDPIEFPVREGQRTLVAYPSGTFEFQWPADDYWILFRGSTQVAVHQGTAGRAVQPGEYRIRPSAEAVFEPVQFTVEAGERTIVSRPSGSFEFQWAGEDYWALFRGDTQVAHHQGTAGRTVQPGEYRIRPTAEAVFEPVDLTVKEDEKTVVGRPSGRFEFRWAGEDYWGLFRGDRQVATHQGTAGRLVQPGTYRIRPLAEAVFEPVELTVLEGELTTVGRPSGSFEFQWPGDDYWSLFRGDRQVATHSGTGGRVVQPGTYRIRPVSGQAFKPVEFTVAEGEKTTVRP